MDGHGTAKGPDTPRPWQRLGARVAALLAGVTLLGIGLVGVLIYEKQKAETEETLGAFLMSIARTGALLVDPALHAEVEAAMRQDIAPYGRLRAALAAIQDENRLDTPIYTLTDLDLGRRQARFMVTSRGPGAPGEPYPLVPALLDPLGRAFNDGVATSTRVYGNQSGTWITAFAPIRDARGRVVAVLDVDYRVDVYLARLRRLRNTILAASLAGAAVAVVAGLLFARRLTGPIAALTRAAARVAAGDLGRPLPAGARDEVGQLTRAFNEMVVGLKQRDFIRDTFGRYVSPEVARTLLESPEGLRLGGEKREVTILMSDLRGYTHFAAAADPAEVVRVLNEYLARMAALVSEHGGTVNEFIGDAVFAIFGAPMAHPDHAERAAACAIAMQRAMADLNGDHAARGLPRFEMGIGLNSGEAVVGNIGSEQRTKYGVVGAAVNLAARVEGCTVGGQILLSPGSYERIREVAEVGPPMPVALKGISEPLALRELRGIAGRWAQRLPDRADGRPAEVTVALPLRCWAIEDKVVRPDALEGEALRLRPREVDARLATALAPLTNVRLRLRYPALERDSADLYGKVLTAREEGGACVLTIALTSIESADEAVLEGLIGQA
ncbi:MAG: HAMP domain-containing protein [Candidatus Rokubacteria bacterium]|nr:HAMP domain-containing protein [Candidatus Rokubacteria bacterium]